MFHRMAGFCRRLFGSKGFRRGLRIFFGVFVAYFIYSIIIYFAAMKQIGVPFGEALRIFFNISLFDIGRIPPSASVAFGIAIGLVWFFSRKRENREKTEPGEKTEEPSDAAREEEIIETTHYRYR